MTAPDVEAIVKRLSDTAQATILAWPGDWATTKSALGKNSASAASLWSQGLLEMDGRGRYRLTPLGQQVRAHIFSQELLR